MCNLIRSIASSFHNSPNKLIPLEISYLKSLYPRFFLLFAFLCQPPYFSKFTFGYDCYNVFFFIDQHFSCSHRPQTINYAVSLEHNSIWDASERSLFGCTPHHVNFLCDEDAFYEIEFFTLGEKKHYVRLLVCVSRKALGQRHNNFTLKF